jgi:RNA polymerase sigma-70 factor (ECF subfamily)
MTHSDSAASDRNSLIMIRNGGAMRNEGFKSLYRRYASYFCGYYQRHGINKADAEDIIQEVFSKIAQNIDSYEENSPLAAWLWTIARNCMRDHFRRTKAQIATENYEQEDLDATEKVPEFQRVYDMKSLKDCVERGLDEFTKVHGDRVHVFSLIVQGFDYDYIAAAIGRTPNATKEYISQCRKRIEQFLLPCQEYTSAD